MKNLITRIKPFTYQIALFLFFLIIYSLTMFPGEGGRINYGDSIKWQYLHLANGLPHSTGYPQFLILTEIFSRLLFFLDMPERITFISVVFGALSMVMFYSLVHLLTRNKLGSVLASLFMGFTYTFWAEATEAEVYTLNIFYLLTIFYLFINFYYTKSNKYYLAGCAVYALSFGNHLTMVTILPAVLFISLATDYRKIFAPKNLLLIALFVGIGMLQYAFIYVRAHSGDPAYMESPYKPDFNQFYGYITGSNFHGQMLSFTIPEILYNRFNVLFQFLNLNFTIIGLLLINAGFFFFLFRRKGYVELAFLSLALIGQLAFNISYDVGDLIVFFIPVYIILGLFLGLIFSGRSIWAPSIVVGVLTLATIWNSIKRMDILTENVFALKEYSLYSSLRENVKARLPVYFRTDAYYHNTYMNYANLTSNHQVYLSNALTPLPDSFLVVRESDYSPELQAQYDLSVKATENAFDFLAKRLKQPSLAIFVSIMDEGAANLPEGFMSLLQANGSQQSNIPYRGSYAALIYNGKIVEGANDKGPTSIDSKNLEQNPLPGNLNFEILSAGFEFGNNSIININGFDYSMKRRGVNFVVYDTAKKKVVDINSFDTHLGEDRKLFLASRRPATPGQ